MLNPTYTRGDAAAYAAWVARQNKYVAPLAAQFRPWEIYELDDGRGTLVSVVGFDSDGKVNLVHVRYNSEKPDAIITVVDHQLTLWGVAELDPVDDKADAA